MTTSYETDLTVRTHGLLAAWASGERVVLRARPFPLRPRRPAVRMPKVLTAMAWAAALAIVALPAVAVGQRMQSWLAGGHLESTRVVRPTPSPAGGDTSSMP